MLTRCKSFLRSVSNEEWAEGEKWATAIEALEDRVIKLEAVIVKIMEDCESGDGWGPDVRLCDDLRDVLSEK